MKYKASYIILLAILALIVIKSLSTSLFFKARDRVSFVIYDQNTTHYSLGLSDSVNYIIPLDTDLQIQVPGGYSYYRLGALAKLISLEKKPDLLKKAFSVLTSTFTSFYFYPNKVEIYYRQDKPQVIIPDFYKIFAYRSNASFFDRIYLFLKLLSTNQNNFRQIGAATQDFFKTYEGYFYQKTYRTENKTVQIIYPKSYKSAVVIGNVLEGNGIKVVDLTNAGSGEDACQVIEGSQEYSKTAVDISAFFRCRLTRGKTYTSDIILRLGKVERDWEIN